MLFKPQQQFIPRNLSTCNTKNNLFCSINCCSYFISVEEEKSFHSRMTDTFITVDKWMIAY